jgi:hypothetical protein
MELDSVVTQMLEAGERPDSVVDHVQNVIDDYISEKEEENA